MSFFKRLEGVFFAPKPTMTAVAEKPVWVDVLVLIMIVLAVYSLVIAPYAKQEQIQMLKDSTKLKETMGAERFDQYLADQEKPATTWKMIQTAGGAPLFFILAMIIQGAILMSGRIFSTQGSFKQVFAALIHANLIGGVLGVAVRLALNLTKKSVMQVSTGLPILFPKMEVTSKAYIILSQVDFFQIWVFAVLALGLAAIFKISRGKALFLSYSVWFLKAIFNIGITILGMSFIR